MKRRVTIAAGASALTLATLVATGVGAGSASAAQDDVLLSLDGVTFAPTLPAGLFDSAGKLVPNDVAHSTLWVKNNTQLDGNLWLSRVDPAGTTTLFSGALSLYETGTTPGEAGPAGAGGASCTLLAPPQPIRAGQAIAVPLTLTVADLDGHDGQNEQVSLQIIAALADAAGPSPGNSFCPIDGASVIVNPGGGSSGNGSSGTAASDPRGSLPFTGVVAAPWIMTGGLLLGAGLFLVATRRTRRRET